MSNTRHLAAALVLCNIAAALLLFTTKSESNAYLESWEDLDESIIVFIQNFGHPAHRIRILTTPVNETLTRRTYTVDIGQGYPQTEFHRQLNRKVRNWGGDTYGVVSFPDRMNTIHITFDGTIVRTVRFQRSTLN